VLREFRVRHDGDKEHLDKPGTGTQSYGHGGETGDTITPDEVYGMDVDAEEPETESAADDSDADVWAEEEEDSRDGMERCSLCDHLIPIFALSAHERFHSVEGE
jgi:DNA polymerase iota